MGRCRKRWRGPQSTDVCSFFFPEDNEPELNTIERFMSGKQQRHNDYTRGISGILLNSETDTEKNLKRKQFDQIMINIHNG